MDGLRGGLPAVCTNDMVGPKDGVEEERGGGLVEPEAELGGSLL